MIPLVLSNDRLQLADLGGRPYTDHDRSSLNALAQRYLTASKPAELLAIGRDLHDWLTGAQGWMERLDRPYPFLLEIRAVANETALLDAPWELLADASGFLAVGGYGPARRVGTPKTPEPRSPHALSVLFMAAAPLGVTSLSYEAEETAIQEATRQFGLKLDLVVEETGTCRELAGRLAALDGVDVLHISCHGLAAPEPALLLEDTWGGTARTTAAQLAQDLGAAGRKTRLLFLSACLTARGREVDSLAVQMLKRGQRAVLGWAGSVADTDAIQFARDLYCRLARGETLEEAVAAVRQYALAPADGRASARGWHLPRLYLGSQGGGALATPGGPSRQVRSHASKAFLDERGGLVSVASHDEFVGRRRQIQQILRAWKQDIYGVLITGLGRLGKSSLAARVAARRSDLRLVVLYGKLDAGAVFRKIADVVGDDVWKNTYAPQVENHPRALEVALRALLSADSTAILLILDDLEQNLDTDHEPARVEPVHALPALAAILRAFRLTPSTNSRLLLTSRAAFTLPDEDRDLAKDLLALPLLGLEPYEARKLASRRGLDSLEQSLLDRCVEQGRGNPGLTELLLRLAACAPDQAKVALSDMETRVAAPMQPDLVALLEGVAVQKLLGLLDEGATSVLRASLLFEVPVPIEVAPVLVDVVGAAPSAATWGRLGTLGLWERQPDPARPGRPDNDLIAVNTLVRSYLKPLSEEEKDLIAGPALRELRLRWTGPQLPTWARAQLGLLAVRVGDASVLDENALDTLYWLDRGLRLVEAGKFVVCAVGVITAAGLSPKPWLLLKGVDVLVGQGELQQAVAWVKTVEEQGSSSPELVGSVALRIGTLLQLAGDDGGAISAFERARDVFEPGTSNYAVAIGGIARVHLARREFEKAKLLNAERLVIFRRDNRRHDVAMTLVDMARIEIINREIEAAEALLLQAEKISHEAGDLEGYAVIQLELLNIESCSGRVKGALARAERIWHLLRRYSIVQGIAAIGPMFAELLFQEGRLEQAREVLEISIPLLHGFGRESEAQAAVELLGIVSGMSRALSDLSPQLARIQSLANLNARCKDAQVAGDRAQEAILLAEIAIIQAQLGDGVAAASSLSRAISLAEAAGEQGLATEFRDFHSRLAGRAAPPS